MNKRSLILLQISLFLAALSVQMYLFGNTSMPKDAKIYVAGHNGLVGKALMRALTKQGYTNILTRSSKELDLRNQQATNDFFAHEKPDYIFLCAAKVGGIHANDTYPASFIYDNLMIAANVIESAYKHTATKLLFLGSSCIYPRNCPQPIKEDYLLTSELEKTNEAYAIAKIAGLKLVEYYNKQYGTNFISCMPTNLYGPYDNFDLKNSHVMPALIRKFDDAKKTKKPYVTLWGSGSVYREFLHVDDLADACLFLMNTYTGSTPVNIGTGSDVTIRELAQTIKKVVGFTGEIVWDSSMPDGTPKKQLNVDMLSGLGWQAQISLEKGIRNTVAWYIENACESHIRK